MTTLGKTKTIKLSENQIITIETGKLAKQADGSVVVKCGDTMLLATVVAKTEAGENVDFMPLSVDYQEKYAATGRVPGGFLKREARPSESEILVARLVDRALRPLFPDDFHAETQVLISLISGNLNVYPDAYACLAASAALAVSDIPFNGPVSEVRIARIDGEFKINPTIQETEQADIDLIVAATIDNIMMVEGGTKEVQEKDMVDALKLAHEAIKIQCQAQIEFMKELGKETKREYCHEKNDAELKENMQKALYQKAYDVAMLGLADKAKRKELFSAIVDEYKLTLTEEVLAEKASLIKKYYHDIEKEAVRNMVLNERVRLDGRKLDEIRPIWSEINYLPSAHGSAIFTRGETQSLTSVTLGTKLDEQLIDGAIFKGTSRLMLHYNFPSFSTGEVKPNRGTGRREIGHGNLALRALRSVIPSEKEINPYTIRIVSDILESNGSSSMATVCAGTLALMDAGVKIRKAVSGIAMGLITDGKGKYAVLSDILGDEDHLGDMDFKVTGTKDGITACQMDIKVDGLSAEVLAEALEQAKRGRLHILNEMSKTISETKADLKPHTPRVENIRIPLDMIGAVIGPGGKIIQEIQKSSASTIVIEEEKECGIVQIFSPNAESINIAKKAILKIVTLPEVGQVYEAKVKSIMPYGAFVEFLPGKEGLLHISEIEWKHLEKVEEVLKEGDIISVKLIAIDAKNGKVKLSRKVLLPKPEEKQEDSTAENN